MGFCKNGKVITGQEHNLGEELSYPEKHCCACGGGATGTGLIQQQHVWDEELVSSIENERDSDTTEDAWEDAD